MEGFLDKKGGSAESTFGRRNWKRRWCELIGTELKYYEALDKTADRATGLKGSIDVFGSTIEIVNHRERKCVFSIQHSGENPFILSADDENMLKNWITALNNASTGVPRGINYAKYYDVLGLSIDDEPDFASVSKAYRKTALRLHPDKGGNLADFKAAQEAFSLLSAKYEDEEEEKKYDYIYYESIIQKGGKGIGFGMIVVDEPKKGYIYIKEVLPTMKLMQLGPEAEGAMKNGDILVKINEDDVSQWPLKHIVQRLNDFRVPVDTEVKLTFARKVLKTETTYNEEDDAPPEAEDNEVEGDSEIDENVAVDNQDNGDNEEEFDIDTSTKTFDQQEASSSIGHIAPTASSIAMSEPSLSSEEVIRLKKQLQELRDELLASQRENEELKRQLGEANTKANDYKAAWHSSKKKEQLLTAQIKQLAIFSELSQDNLHQAKAEMSALSAKLAQGRPLAATSEDVERDLQLQGLGSDSIGSLSTQQDALRTAQIAASLVDPSGGKLLQQWANNGDNAASKLSRLQQRLNQYPNELPRVVDRNNQLGSGAHGSYDGNNESYNQGSLGASLQRAASRNNFNNSSGSNFYDEGFNGQSYSPNGSESLSPNAFVSSASPDRSATLNRLQSAGKKSKSYMSATQSSSRNIRGSKSRGELPGDA